MSEPLAEIPEDGTPVICLGTMVGVPKGTPAILRHQSPGGHSNLPRMFWLELDDYIYWSFGHSEHKGYWGTAAEFVTPDVEPTP